MKNVYLFDLFANGLAWSTSFHKSLHDINIQVYLFTWPFLGLVWHKKLWEKCRGLDALPENVDEFIKQQKVRKEQDRTDEKRRRRRRRVLEMLTGTNYKASMYSASVSVHVWLCVVLWLQVAWRALGWPRFQSARRRCWHWGTRLGLFARRQDMPSSIKTPGTVLRTARRPLRSICLSPMSVFFRPLLVFHLINTLTPLQRFLRLTGETSHCIRATKATSALSPHAGICSRRRVRRSLQRTCKRYGRLFKSTSHTVWLLLLKVNTMLDTVYYYFYLAFCSSFTVLNSAFIDGAIEWSVWFEWCTIKVVCAVYALIFIHKTSLSSQVFLIYETNVCRVLMICVILYWKCSLGCL